jgi:ribonuclease/clavin/mitogillin
MASQLPDLPAITKLSPRVIRILGGNPSKYTLQGTNTYLIGTGPNRTLLDTGHGIPVWINSIKQVLKDENAQVNKVILTHWHPDHVGGVKDIRELVPNVELRKHKPGEGWDGAENIQGFEDGDVFETEGATLKAVHSPGHTTDHMAFHLVEEDALFTGDNVLGHGTAVFEDLSAYMASLQKMASVFSGRAYPGHGGVIDDGKAKVLEYIEHRKKREVEVMDVLGQKRADGVDEIGSMDLVKVIYKAYPEHLHQPAEGNLLHVLHKLEGEGKVGKEAGKWRLVDRERL